MNVLIAPDSFKDCLPAEQVSEAMKQGVLHILPESRCAFLPASDGGEGFLEAVHSFIPDSHWKSSEVQDPLGRKMETKYLWQEETQTAYIELARASGLELLEEEERTPMNTSTFGTGMLLKAAIDHGAKHIYVGIGGSATNDGGTGIAAALGYVFCDKQGIHLVAKGSNLASIEEIDLPEELPLVKVYAVNDVNNPLYGKNGAAYTYAKQKGASEIEIEQLDQGLAHLDGVVKKIMGKDEGTTPGSGAAGGTAYGLKVFLDAEFIDGTTFLLRLAKFDDLIQSNKIDLILTGEGKIDEQTAHGKFVYGLTQNALNHQIPVIAICGKLNLKDDGVKALGLHSAFEIYDPQKDPEYSYTNAFRLIAEKTKHALSLIHPAPDK